MGGAPPGLVVHGSVRKQVELALRSKPVSSNPPWLLQQLLWWFECDWPYRLVGSGTTVRRCGFVGVGVVLSEEVCYCQL